MCMLRSPGVLPPSADLDILSNSGSYASWCVGGGAGVFANHPCPGPHGAVGFSLLLSDCIILELRAPKCVLAVRPRALVVFCFRMLITCICSMDYWRTLLGRVFRPHFSGSWEHTEKATHRRRRRLRKWPLTSGRTKAACFETVPSNL